MRYRVPFTKLALCLCLFGLASTARADLRWVETVDVFPTASVVELPRTYLVPSSYVSTRTVMTPTSIVYPTTTTANVYDVVPTYFVPSSYISTRFYRAYRPRRYVETTYVSSYPTTLTPTYYVTPNTYLSPTPFITSTRLVATSTDLCCDSGASPVIRVAPVTNGTAPAKETQKSADTYEPRPRATIDSSVASEPDYRTEANKPVRDESLNTTKGPADPQPMSGTQRKALPGSGAAGSTSDPEQSSAVGTLGDGGASSSASTEADKPAAPKEKTVVRDSASGQSGSGAKNPTSVNPANATQKKSAPLDPKTAIPPPIVTPPVAPEPDPIRPQVAEPPSLDSIPALPEPKVEEGSRRDSLKPVFPSNTILRSKRNVLEGKIVSADSLNPEENVEVVISDRAGRYVDRTTRTNAFGQFAVSLPEGDWTIKVKMPSGRILGVDQGGITANAGKIIDMYGRDLNNLVIKR